MRRFALIALAALAACSGIQLPPVAAPVAPVGEVDCGPGHCTMTHPSGLAVCVPCPPVAP